MLIGVSLTIPSHNTVTTLIDGNVHPDSSWVQRLQGM